MQNVGAARLHDLLRASTDRAPSAPVFVRDGRSTTYAELDTSAGRVAAGLHELGVHKGDRVALVIDGDVDYLVAYYAALKAGAVVVPLCSDTRTAPLVHALAHSGARAVVLDAAAAPYLAGQAPQLPELRLLVQRGGVSACAPFACVAFESLVQNTMELHDAGVSCDGLASITYTSGTTGAPKGVMLAHRNAVANVRSIVQYLELTPRDRVAMVLPFYYVYGNSVLHTHVCAGGAIVHAGSVAFPGQVMERIASQRCTGLSGVPATFARLLAAQGALEHDLGSLRYLTSAGAAMPQPLVQRVRAAFPHAQLFVMYGQTEAAARLAYVPPDMLAAKLGSAGRAIPGVELRILDERGREVPRGTVGEVVARGDNVMLGYWNDPEATARVLRADGLHTGDLAYMDGDGFVFIAGRKSELIKSGAHRIAPAEIEQVIARVPGVHECAVAGVPHPVLGEAIAAFVVPIAGARVDRQRVLRACLAELPRFKLPEHVLELRELPRTANGKVRRADLVTWYRSQGGELR
jgi:acyl-CoA synthetase (AMP-forming)/AMP-acid ligase II